MSLLVLSLVSLCVNLVAGLPLCSLASFVEDVFLKEQMLAIKELSLSEGHSFGRRGRIVAGAPTRTHRCQLGSPRTLLEGLGCQLGLSRLLPGGLGCQLGRSRLLSGGIEPKSVVLSTVVGPKPTEPNHLHTTAGVQGERVREPQYINVLRAGCVGRLLSSKPKPQP